MAAITIRDVARLAQVSVATVSRALNGQGHVAEAVRERVAEAARQLQYTPHAGARSLSRRRTNTLGIVLPRLAAGFFHDLLRGMDDAARNADHHLLLAAHHADDDAMLAAMRAMHGRVDGLVVMGNADAALRAGVEEPLLQIGTALSPGAPAVAIDHHAGAMAMVEHLVAIGHQRIAFIAGPSGHAPARERLGGYLEAMARLLPRVEPCVVPGDFDRTSGIRAALTLMGAPELPDAVFAGNDQTALGCLHAFARTGVSVPDSLSVVGYDDTVEAGLATPGLTTMRVDGAELGRRAVRRLLASLGEGGSPAMVVTEALVPTLTVRDSTASRVAAALANAGPQGRRVGGVREAG
ncbi:LacI family DNA-binding transcriptional regulator [Cognatilysobacter tabacisoli]|uniref:LacI family DNA-binding transcriptional regulator n=1 Tax=Cognatilysobacter tabacisoli TaxID=2315424 RepID=UPI000E6B0ABD|nr:LacI family DNA-binding transcriptional regulator [Lysobacter tabacisoli]